MMPRNTLVLVEERSEPMKYDVDRWEEFAMALNWGKVAVKRDHRMDMPVPVDQLEIRRTVMPADRQVTTEAAVCQFRF